MATCAIFVSLASSWGDRWTEHVKRYATHHLLVRERYFFILSFVLLLLLHKTDICVYFNCFDTVPLHPQHLFSFLLCVCDWHCAEQNQKMNGEETQGIQKKLTSIWHVIDVKSVTFNDWPTFIYQMNFEFSQHSTEDFFTFQLFVLVVMPAALSKTPQNHNISLNKLIKK